MPGVYGTDSSLSFFDPANKQLNQSLLSLQMGSTNLPTPTAVTSATGMLIPDKNLFARISNFQSDLYDLRDSSHLVRFLQSLLGDAGAGQLRKRQQISRLAEAMTSTHFFDLDRFYGAIFGALRESNELFDFDPSYTPATQDEWDQIHAADAAFREKIINLGKAIAMGACPQGMIAAAEAILGAPVALYEDWQLLDPLGRDNVGPDDPDDPTFYITWNQVISGSDFSPAHPTYTSLEGTLWGNIGQPASIPIPTDVTFISWNKVIATYGPVNPALYSDLEDYTWNQLGGTGQVAVPPVTIPYGDRFGFQLVPLKKYDSGDDYVNLVQKSADVYEIQRVLRRLKPAHAQMTVDPEGLDIVTPVAIANFSSPSSYWEVVTQVAPKDASTAKLYPLSAGQTAAGVQQSDVRTLPVFAFQGSQLTEWHYNGEVVAAVSYLEDDEQNMVSSQNYETVTFYDGTQLAYTAEKGVMDPAVAWGSILAKQVSANAMAR